jgi:hypothetical protein
MAFKRVIFPVSQQTQCIGVTQKDQVILFSAVIAVCFESHAEHLNARDGITLSV